MNPNYWEMASALYDGGWRVCDLDELREEYQLSDTDIVGISQWLVHFQNEESE